VGYIIDFDSFIIDLVPFIIEFRIILSTSSHLLSNFNYIIVLIILFSTLLHLFSNLNFYFQFGKNDPSRRGYRLIFIPTSLHTPSPIKKADPSLPPIIEPDRHTHKEIEKNTAGAVDTIVESFDYRQPRACTSLCGTFHCIARVEHFVFH
jgi:hypothetical protein